MTSRSHARAGGTCTELRQPPGIADWADSTYPGGRRGKERAARHERSSDWRRGAEPPDPEDLDLKSFVYLPAPGVLHNQVREHVLQLQPISRTSLTISAGAARHSRR